MVNGRKIGEGVYVIVLVIFTVYMLLDKERLILQGKRMLKAYASDVLYYNVGKSD